MFNPDDRREQRKYRRETRENGRHPDAKVPARNGGMAQKRVGS